MRSSDIWIGTTDGLFDASGVRIGLDGRTIVAADSDWLIVDGTELWAADPLERRASWDGPALRCVAGGVCGTAEAGLVRLRGTELVRVDGFDEVETRSEWYTPWGGPPDTRSLSLAQDGTLYVNVHVGSTLRSTDRCATFDVTALPIGTDVHEVVAAGGWLLAPGAVGLAWSRDTGTSWTIEADGLHSTYLRSATLAGDVVLVSAADGPSADHGAIYRKAGDTFEKCDGGLPEWLPTHIDSGCMRAFGTTVVAAAVDGTVWRSDDAGTTWSAAVEGLPEPRCVSARSV